MLTPQTGFVDCTTCFMWADIPLGMDLRKHFAQCPTCMKIMYFSPTDPAEIHMSTKFKMTCVPNLIPAR